MTREQAERMIAEHLEQIADIIAEYYPKDGYLSASINWDAGVIQFNNTHWEHAVGKLYKVKFWKGGEWRDAKFIRRDLDVQSEE